MSSVRPRIDTMAGIFGGLILTHLFISVFLTPPGYITYDTVEYHVMSRNFSETHGFFIENGFQEHPSPELAFIRQLIIKDGHLVAISPELFNILTYPFYKIFGYKGLLYFNMLVFICVNILVFNISKAYFSDRRIAFSSVIIYSLFTYSWVYSQSEYPHLASTFFIVLAFYLATLSTRARDIKRSMAWGFWSGMACGFATGVRLDGIFALPGILYVFLQAPRGWSAALAFLIGILPCMVFMGVVNEIKFGSPNPFSYGGESDTILILSYIPVILIVATIFTLAVLYKSYGLRTKSHGLLVVSLFIAMGCFIADFRDSVTRLFAGVYMLVINAGALGEVITGVKASLLQSCPYMASIIYLFSSKFISRKYLHIFITMMIVPLVYIFFYGYFSWHGSQIVLNMRYLNPALPFLAILSAYAWRELSLPWPTVRIVRRGAMIACGFSILFLFLPVDNSALQGVVFLSFPLLIVTVLISGILFKLYRPSRFLDAILHYILISAFAWSSAMTFGRDYLNQVYIKHYSYAASQKLAPHIQDDSIIFCEVPFICAGLLDGVNHLRIAYPAADHYASFLELAEFHLKHGRNVYLYVSSDEYNRILERGYFPSSNYILDILGEHNDTAQIMKLVKIRGYTISDGNA